MRNENILALIIIIGTIGYILFRSQVFLFGPTLIVHSPLPHSTIQQLTIVDGITENAVFLTINDQRVFPDRNGLFREEVLLPVGYTIVEVYARSRQGKEKVVRLPLYVEPHNPQEQSDAEQEQSDAKTDTH